MGSSRQILGNKVMSRCYKVSGGWGCPMGEEEPVEESISKGLNWLE